MLFRSKRLTLCHAAALALVGWYLMTPPLARDLDKTCKSDGPLALSDITIALLTWTSPDVINSRRCDRLRLEVQNDAPLSEWKQGDSFETLEACQAEHESDQKLPNDLDAALIQLVALSELQDEGYSHPSKEDQQSRGKAIESSLQLQDADEKCIATDDPRLKGN